MNTSCFYYKDVGFLVFGNVPSNASLPTNDFIYYFGMMSNQTSFQLMILSGLDIVDLIFICVLVYICHLLR